MIGWGPPVEEEEEHGVGVEEEGGASRGPGMAGVGTTEEGKEGREMEEGGAEALSELLPLTNGVTAERGGAGPAGTAAGTEGAEVEGVRPVMLAGGEATAAGGRTEGVGGGIGEGVGWVSCRGSGGWGWGWDPSLNCTADPTASEGTVVCTKMEGGEEVDPGGDKETEGVDDGEGGGGEELGGPTSWL